MNFPRILKKRKGYIDRIKPFMQKSVVKVQGKRTSANCLIINSSLLFSKLI